MARRIVGNFALIVALAGLAEGGRAQTCEILATGTPSVRAEGMAEMVGDILIQCTGGTPTPAGQPLQIITISVQSEQDMASRFLGTFGMANWQDVLLFMDEPLPGAQYYCAVASSTNCPAYGNGTGAPTYYGSGVSTPSAPRNPNVYQGANTAVGQLGGPLLFFVWFDPPGPNATRTMRIKNLRINANQFGVSPGTTRSASFTVRIDPLGVTSKVRVALIQHGLAASLRDAVNGSEMQSIPWKAQGASTPEVIATLRYDEAFPSVFRRRTDTRPTAQVPPPPVSQNILGVVHAGESGFVNLGLPPPPGAAVSTAPSGLADSGTRLLARFSGVPPGAQLYVQAIPPVLSLQGPGGGSARATVSGPLGDQPFSAAAVGANGLTPVSAPNGSGHAVWEVVDADQTTMERVDIRVWATYPAGASRPNGQVLLDFAPVDAPGVTVIPRFAIKGGSTPAASCNFGSNYRIAVPVDGGPVPIRATPAAGCEWQAISSAPWLTSSGILQGPATAQLRAAFNLGPPRTARVTLGNIVIDVEQAGPTAPYAAPTITAPLPNQTIGAGGITFSWVPPSIDRSAPASIPGRVYHELRLLRFDGRILHSGALNTEVSGNTVLIDVPAGQTKFLVRSCLQPRGAGGVDVGAPGCGAWGSVDFQATTPTPPSPPTVTAPVPNQTFTNSTVTFQWQPVTGASAYAVRISRFVSTVLRIRVPAPNTSTVYSLPDGDYTAQFSSCIVLCGASFPFQSTGVQFRVTLPPIPTGAPTIAQATVNSSNSLAATWNPLNGADIYRVQVVQPNAGPGGGALTVASGQTATTNISLNVPPGPAFLFVAACNGNGCGPYSPPSAINPSGPASTVPVIGTPIPGTSVDGPGVLFTWSRVAGDNGSNTTYRLYAADLSRSATAGDVHTTDNFAALQFASEGNRYDAVVAANPGPSQTVSAPVGFQVLGTSPGAPTLVSPGHRSVAKTGIVQIGWTPVERAQLYEYFLSIPPSGGMGLTTVAAAGVTPGTFTQLSLTPGNYSLIVRACTDWFSSGDPDYCLPGGTDGWGPWSNEPGGPGVTNFSIVP